MNINKGLVTKLLVAFLAAANLVWLYGFEYRMPGRTSAAPVQQETAVAATTAAAQESAAAAATQAAPEEEEAEVMTCRVTAANSLRVRSGPGTEFEVIASVKYEDVLTVLGVENDWVHIRTGDGLEGYVSTQYVEIIE